jgi:hypothetical protein
MSNPLAKSRLTLSLCAVAALLSAVAPLARAGGPLLIGADGNPIRWAASEVRGGPLNSQTVGVNQNGVRQVFYHVDSGPLGTLNNSQATSLVDRIFRLYTDIPTADIDFVNGGPILDPSTGSAVDVNGSNVGKFLSDSNPTFQNPIIFDSDGAITGSGGVLGFFRFLQFDSNSDDLREGAVVLNGRVLTRGLISPSSFLGVFTHEFGHFAGPLDHAQINGNIASQGDGSVLPAGYDASRAYDTFAPFTETLYPFIFPAPPQSQFINSFQDSGFFIASVDLDTQNALSNLYPSSGYMTTSGSIEGRVLIRTSTGDVPITGIDVIARRIDRGPYPPPPSTQAFPASPTVDSDGIPAPPPAQAATDSLATVSSAVTGVGLDSGAYRLNGLPAGQYMVGIQQINPTAVRGSGIGPLSKQILLMFAEEFYNGPNNSSNTVDVFLPVSVTAGQATAGIDIILNGISAALPPPISEVEPNDNMKKPERLSVPIEVIGSAAFDDSATFKMTLPDGSKDTVEDTYRIDVAETRTFFIILEPISGTGDLDMYLFDAFVNKKKSSFDDPSLIDFSAGPTASELIVARLVPGTYKIGISAFAGSVNYRLRIIASNQ